MYPLKETPTIDSAFTEEFRREFISSLPEILVAIFGDNRSVEFYRQKAFEFAIIFGLTKDREEIALSVGSTITSIKAPYEEIPALAEFKTYLCNYVWKGL